MDEHIQKKLSAFLRTDVDLPDAMREFLADALDHKHENWRIEWVGAKRGPQNTRATWAKRHKKEHDAAVAALRAVDQIEAGIPTEAAIAEMMASAGLTRAEAFDALKKCREALPYIRTLGDFES